LKAIWRRFDDAAKLAIIACNATSDQVSHHFADAGKMVSPSIDKPPCVKLTLKNGQTTIQRVLQQGKHCIEKQYFGNLLPNQQREAEFVF
jgi:uncharacterized protein with PhoU and TrkA domain